jgi:hypothetical protein
VARKRAGIRERGSMGSGLCKRNDTDGFQSHCENAAEH